MMLYCRYMLLYIEYMLMYRPPGKFKKGFQDTKLLKENWLKNYYVLEQHWFVGTIHTYCQLKNINHDFSVQYIFFFLKLFGVTFLLTWYAIIWMFRRIDFQLYGKTSPFCIALNIIHFLLTGKNIPTAFSTLHLKYWYINTIWWPKPCIEMSAIIWPSFLETTATLLLCFLVMFDVQLLQNYLLLLMIS